jgi:hypothetical protein
VSKSYRHYTQHEVEFSTDNLDACWWAKYQPKLQAQLVQAFGPRTTVNMQFVAYWEMQPAEPEAGYLTGYFEVAEVELESVTTFIDGDEQTLDETSSHWELLTDVATDIAIESGEDPNNSYD